MPLRHVMYAYFEYGETARYVVVRRIPGGYEAYGRRFPKESAASGEMALRLKSALMGTVSRPLEKESGTVSSLYKKESGTEKSETVPNPRPPSAVILAPGVPRYVADTFVSIFGPSNVFTGELEEPRVLIARYSALEGPPYWWSPPDSANWEVGTGKGGNVDNWELETGIGNTGNIGNNNPVPGDSLPLRHITARIGKGRYGVSVMAEDAGGIAVECGVWSPVKRRILKAEEELSRLKCRFSEANPGATVMQKRIFAEVAARHLTFRSLSPQNGSLAPKDGSLAPEENWGQSPEKRSLAPDGGAENWGQAPGKCDILAQNGSLAPEKRSLAPKNWGLSPIECDILRQVANFVTRYNAVVVVEEEVAGTRLAGGLVAAFGHGRVFLPPELPNYP